MVTGPDNPGLPGIATSGYMAIGDQGDATPWFHRDGTWMWSDALSINRGSHNFNAGFEARVLATSRAANNYPRGTMSFTDEMSGNAAADLILGFPRKVITPSPTPWIHMPQWRYGGYVFWATGK